MDDQREPTDAERAALLRSPDAAFVVHDGFHVAQNTAGRALFKLDDDHVLDQPFPVYVHPDDRAASIERYRRALAGELIHGVAERSRDPDGEWRYLELSVGPTTWCGEPAVIYTVRDVTHRVITAATRDAEHSAVAEIVDNATIGMALLDADGRIVRANPALVEIVGRDPRGARLELLLDTGRRADDLDAGNGARLVRHTDGTTVELEVTSTPLADAGPRTPMMVQLRDVTAERRAQRELERMATTDGLTDLRNRTAFLAAAHELLAEGPAAVVFADLDRFKLVNDSYGHAAGDRLLTEIANRLRGALRPGDVLSRFGGDEFTVVCPGVHDEAAAIDIAGRLQQSLLEPINIGTPGDPDATAVHARMSIGVALGDGGSDPAQLLARSDAALYEAKRRGRDRVVVSAEDSSWAARSELALDGGLRRALRNGDIRAGLQPLWRMADCSVVGFEALARWTLPDGTAARPDRFVALAAELGLAIDLDLQIAGDALRTLACLRRDGLAPEGGHVGINVQPELLTDPAGVDALAEVAEAAGMAMSDIVVELTEQRLPSDTDALLAGVRRIRDHGALLALDDFGEGHTSLGRILSVPFDVLKLDRAFVPHLSHARGRDVLAGVVGMGRAMNVTIIVEGVETDEERRILHRLGAPIGQGWLVAPALLGENLRSWLRNREIADAAPALDGAPAAP